MNDDVLCVRSHATVESLIDRWLRDLEKRGYDERKAAADADTPCDLDHIPVGFVATTAVANHNHCLFSHVRDN